VDLDDNGVWEEGDEFIVSGWGVTSVSNLSFSYLQFGTNVFSPLH